MSGEDRALGLSYDGAFFTSESHSTKQNQPGIVVRKLAKEGYRFFRYMKAEAAFAIGQVAMIGPVIDNADVDAAATTSETTLTATSDFTANEFNDGTFPSAYVSIDANTGIGQTRSIIGNRGSTSILSLENNAWDTALDTTSDYITYDVNYVTLADAATARISTPMGVAISAITDEQWGWFQVGGFCPLVRCVGTTDPTIRGALITTSTTAGACKGPTAGGTTADDVAVSFGMAYAAHASADSAGRGIPAMLHCRYAMIV